MCGWGGGWGGDTGERMRWYHFVPLPAGSPSDYMSWAEHRDSDSCLLGYKDTYNLTKTSSM